MIFVFLPDSEFKTPSVSLCLSPVSLYDVFFSQLFFTFAQVRFSDVFLSLDLDALRRVWLRCFFQFFLTLLIFFFFSRFGLLFPS